MAYFRKLQPRRYEDDGLVKRRKYKINVSYFTGKRWKAVAQILHTGDANGGHYRCCTVEEDGQWWMHDDDVQPITIGKDYHKPIEGVPKSMKGTIAILFEQIDKPMGFDFQPFV